MGISESETLISSNIDWELVTKEFQESYPFNRVVIDNFFNLNKLEELRNKIINHWGWRYKNWKTKNLHNRLQGIDEISEISNFLINNCRVFKGLEMLDYWAILHNENQRFPVHSDKASIALNIWLTPNKCNLDPSSGGLILYSIREDPEILISTIPTLAQNEEYIKIDYKYNRAVMFDGNKYHQTDRIDFLKEPSCFRMNLTLTFEVPIINNRTKKTISDAITK